RERLAHERRDHGERVHGEHDAQDRAKVAKVRQRGSDGDLPYNRPDIEPGMQASCPGDAPDRCPRERITGYCRQAPTARQAEPRADVEIPALRSTAVGIFALPAPPAGHPHPSLAWQNPRTLSTLPPPAGQAASASPCPSGSNAIRRRSNSIGG